ncbi:hypothetical protein PAAG_00643 [Paracoccidioides lutzii Pb01]|uniref:Uncharacterized protein n=1 Tax=Paracoccidioides lutzii (strain ATCC MYA-826 / Pb01) TaxID=502779 RepID=C1GQ48_PARBA|nr:hypothetical protein PAAG_00643 [Paracoccidioides lutzii Pb01]EEH37722.2 hypothetical protein PAAG_00643 [Paracoccidioides lutzii Pb01]
MADGTSQIDLWCQDRWLNNAFHDDVHSYHDDPITFWDDRVWENCGQITVYFPQGVGYCQEDPSGYKVSTPRLQPENYRFGLVVICEAAIRQHIVDNLGLLQGESVGKIRFHPLPTGVALDTIVN